MALIVEDGTGKSDAESYASVANADAYHASRGNTEWDDLPDEATKEVALRKATDYMEQVYRQRWDGCRVSATQALSWPRYDVQTPDMNGLSYVSHTVVPVEIVRACCILALKSTTEELLEDGTQAILRERVGPIETYYDPTSPQVKRYRSVNAMVAVYLAAIGANSYTVVRR